MTVRRRSDFPKIKAMAEATTAVAAAEQFGIPVTTLRSAIRADRDAGGSAPQPGYVYAMSNEWMPGLIKIGRSFDVPEERALQLYGTGVPGPFTVELSSWMLDSHTGEKALHMALNGHRVNGAREFFNVEPHFLELLFDLLDDTDDETSEAA